MFLYKLFQGGLSKINESQYIRLKDEHILFLISDINVQHSKLHLHVFTVFCTNNKGLLQVSTVWGLSG